MRHDLLVAAFACAALATGVAAATDPDCPATVDHVRLTVVADDHPGAPGLRHEMGFACLVEGPQSAVLFDTGRSPEVLAENLRALGVATDAIELVVLSHGHGDHVGGLAALIGDRSRPLTIYAPSAISDAVRATAGGRARVAPVTGAMSIHPGVCTLGEMGDEIVEQAMVVHTARGLVVITGCAHPGIASIVERARDLMGAEVLLVAGGFHLRAAEPPEIAASVRRLVELGVRHVAPCHCTGEEATVRLEEAFGSRCHRLAVGTRLDTAELE